MTAPDQELRAHFDAAARRVIWADAGREASSEELADLFEGFLARQKGKSPEEVKVALDIIATTYVKPAKPKLSWKMTKADRRARRR